MDLELAGKSFHRIGQSQIDKGDSMSKLIGELMQMSFPSESGGNFGPLVHFYGHGRSIIPSDLTPEQIDELKSYLEGVDEPWVCSRIADVLFQVSPKNDQYPFAVKAFEAYLTVANDIDLSIMDVSGVWSRMISLSSYASKKQKGELEKLIQSHTQMAPEKFDNNSYSILSAIQGYAMFKRDAASQLVRIGDHLMNQGNVRCAPRYFEAALATLKDQDKTPVYSKLGQCYFRQTDWFQSNIQKIPSLDQAVMWLTKIPSKQRVEDEVDNLLVQAKTALSEAKALAVNEMNLHSVSIPKPDFSEFFKQIEQQTNHQNLITLSGLSDSESKQLRTAIDILTLYAVTILQPTIQHIQSKGFDPAEELAAICQSSSVSNGPRIQLWYDALQFGFHGRYDIAVILLGPLMEAWLRDLLKTNNVDTQHQTEVGAAGDGYLIDDEVGMTSLLAKTESLGILGERLHFLLQAIFSERVGFNLRNKVAHGLFDDKLINESKSLICWWFCLRLVMANQARL